MSNGESVARTLRVCRESCSCKLEQPNEGRSQNLCVNFLRYAVRTSKTAGSDAATPSATATGTTADRADNDDSFASCEQQSGDEGFVTD